jgi:hypothetical protein
MASWGLLGGLGAGMSQAGQNMFEQAKQDRINEFRMQLQQEQNAHNSKESAKDRQHRADLQADQQRFTAQQAQLKAKNDLAVAQVKGVKPDWQKVELADGSVIFVDPNTGKQQFVSSNPVMHVNGDANLPPTGFHNVGGSIVRNTGGSPDRWSNQEGTTKEELAKKARGGLLTRTNSLNAL